MNYVRPKKHLGQHFLKDESIAQEITLSIDESTVNLLEIGPGTGVLTKYLLKNETNVELAAYDLNGRKISTLVSALKPAGLYSIKWNTEKIVSGVYYLQLKTSDGVPTKRMIIKR